MPKDTIRVVRIHEHGGPEVLRIEDAPRPEPGPAEVRVRMGAMALNHLDVWVRRGIPGVRFPLPVVPGSDGAGVVDALGAGVGGPVPGTRVFVLPATSCGRCQACLSGVDNLCAEYRILGEHRDGTAAETVVLPAANVAPLPDDVDMAGGASFGLSFLTAWQMLVHKARVVPGDRVLVHAAASGVSTAGLQIARHLGAIVAATAGTAAKRALARKLGADLVVDYGAESWVDEVRDWAGGPEIDVVFDHVGADTLADSLRVLKRGGRYVFCGSTSGHELATDLRRLFYKNLEILGSTMGRRGDLFRIAGLMGAGRLRPVVDRAFSLDKISDAHRRLEARQALGKVVVTIDEDVR
ncbi:MAG: zinc-binding dehydrogenase [Acidobacteriota bacterium]|nr:zinc-binding dehydrogenase [Acidobacteriota bacterium]